MADIGNISFTVDTAGLEQGAQALNTFDAAQKNAAAGAQQLNTAQQQTASVTTATVEANQNLSTSTTATAQSFSLFGSILNSLSSAFSSSNSGMAAASASARALGSEHESARASTMALREAMYSLAPAAYAAGIPITGLGAIMHAARGGIEILAVAIAGGLVAAMESAADKANILSGRLSDILGKQQGSAAFDGLQKSAASANVSMQLMEPTVEALLQAQHKLSNASGFRFVGDIPSQFAGLSQAETAVTAFTKALQLNGETGSVASKSVDGYYQEMLKIDTATGKFTGLTSDIWDKIVKESTAGAQAIAQALGFGEGQQAVVALTAKLQQAAIPLEQFQRGVAGAGSAIGALYDAMPPNLVQSFDRLKVSATELFTVIGKSDAGSGFASNLTSISTALKAMSIDIENGTGFWSAFWKQIQDGPEENQAKLDKFNADLQGLFTPPQGWQTMFTQLGDLILNALHLDGARSAIKSFLDETDQMFTPWINSVANSIMAVVEKAVAGIQAMLAAASQSPLSGAMTSPGMPSFDATGVNSTTPDLSATAELSDTSNLVGFATGGAFTVAGSGGSDSQLVRFMGTPGETVTITPEGLTAPSGLAGADTAGPLTNTMTTTGTATGQATSAITVAGSPAKPTSANESLANAVSQGTGGLVTTLSGAKVDIVTAVNQMNANVSAALASIAASTKAATPAATAAAVSAGGVKISGNINPTYTDQAKQAAAEDKATTAALAVLDKQDAAASALHDAAIDLQNGAATQAEKALYASNLPAGFDAGNLLGSQGKQAQGSSIVMKQIGAPPNSKSPTGPSFDATSSSFDESGFTSAYNPSGGYAPPNSVTAPSSQLDSMMNYGSDYSGPTPYTDSSYYDYASSAATYASPDSPDYYGSMATDYGYYASGTPSGGFTVGGSGGTDSQPVLIHASPGEKVSVGSGDSQQDVARHIGRDNQKIEFSLKGATRSQPSFVASISQMRRAFGSL